MITSILIVVHVVVCHIFFKKISHTLEMIDIELQASRKALGKTLEFIADVMKTKPIEKTND